MRAGLLLVVVMLGALVGGGCRSFWRPRLALPSEHTLVREQLVIRSDFPLPPHHRLIEELVARRNDLAAQLGLPMSGEPIEVYLFQDSGRFEAFMHLRHPGFPPRRAYFLETDTRLEVYAQWGDHLAEDLRHEVTHGYLHAVVPNLPLWLDEGLAEYCEVPRGHRGLNREHLEELSRQLATGQWRPDLVRLEHFSPNHAMSQLDYAESWAWVHLLLETRPELQAVLRAYIQDLIRSGMAEPLSLRLRRAGVPPEPVLVAHIRQLAVAGR